MVVRYFRMARALTRRVQNPMPAVLDRLGVYRGRYTVVLRDGLKVELRAASGDRSGFYEVLVRGDYTAHGQRIESGDTVVDVGANIGCFTLLASRMVGRAGRVIAIEPEERTFAQLMRNIELNDARNVIPCRVLLGGREGEMQFFSGGSSLAGSIYRSSRHTQEQKIPMTTLDALFRSVGVQGCNYMKLDCEGAEYEILDSLTPEAARKIEQISLEVHRIPGRKPEEVHGRLTSLGFHEVSNERVHYYRRR